MVSNLGANLNIFTNHDGYSLETFSTNSERGPFKDFWKTKSKDRTYYGEGGHERRAIYLLRCIQTMMETIIKCNFMRTFTNANGGLKEQKHGFHECCLY